MNIRQADAVIIEKLLGFAMVMTRISAFFLVAPIFGSPSIPQTMKISVIVLLSVFFAMINPPVAAAQHASAIQAMLLLGGEATYGLALGIIAGVLFATEPMGKHVVVELAHGGQTGGVFIRYGEAEGVFHLQHQFDRIQPHGCLPRRAKGL